MPDTAPEPIRFPVTVTTNGIRVEIVLLLKPGTVVSVAETKTTAEPKSPR
jgi:hypothetical protein